jgi:hypothetical protein
MALTTSELGALFLVLFGLFYWLGIFAKLRSVLAFLGAVWVGSGGFVGRLFTQVGVFLQHIGGAVTAWAFGGAILGLGFIIVAVIFIHDMHPKNGASKRTGWVALLAGILLGSAAAVIPALAPVVSAVQSIPQSVTTFLNSL